MVQLQQFLKTNLGLQSDKPLPLLNSLFSSKFSLFSQDSSEQSFKTYMRRARRSPQVMGLIDVITIDMISDGVEFKPIDKENGEEKVEKAEKFWLMNHGKDVAQETIYDMLLNGIGYNWRGAIGEAQLKEFCKEIVHITSPEMKAANVLLNVDRLTQKIKSDQADRLVRKLRHVASSTVTIISDEHEPTSYVQRV